MSTQLQLTDVDVFCAHLNSEASAFFNTDESIMISRAPGRLDVMGGIGDYSGCLVLEMPLANATLCAAQARTDDRIVLCSVDPGQAHSSMQIEYALNELQSGALASIDQARSYFESKPDEQWAAYIVGVLIVLKEKCGLEINQGITFYVNSQVPLGKGVSSSAALEVACMQAACAVYGKSLDPIQLAVHCQQVENLVVGAPCGLMDQMASSTGQSHHLMRMHCQPADVQGHIPIPEHLGVWGIDSGIRHAVGGSDYGSVRVAAFMAYRILADQLGFDVERNDEGLSIADNKWNNYLANVSLDDWQNNYAEQIPEQISGAEFIERYQNTHDSVTSIDSEAIYYPRRCAWYPVGEQDRVERFVELLEQVPSEDKNIRLGEIMFASHDAYSAIGLGSDGTDHLVKLVKEIGPQGGLYGAKISGGGSGGTVAILGRHDAQSAVEEVMRRYAAESGREPELFSSSSPGAGAFGTIKFTLDKG